MNNYYFFIKSGKIIATQKLNKNEIQKLIAKGYEKQFEEIKATSAKKALERFVDIRGEEIKNVYALSGPDIFLGIIGTITMIFK